MRTAVVSDIHGNRTAFEAVLADLRETAPDLILHGGDLADSGASPVEIVDRIRDLGWKGVAGNTDEMLYRPESLQAFAARTPQLKSMFDAIEEMAAYTREALGAERLAWLRELPRIHDEGSLALVHASPESLWSAPGPQASDEELESTFGPIGRRMVVYGHVHRPFVRRLAAMTIANSGSAGLPYDGDRRAAYLLIDDDTAAIRRVEYDVETERRVLADCRLPHSDWVARMLESGSPQMP